MNDELSAYYAARASEYERIYEKPERQADLAGRAFEYTALEYYWLFKYEVAP